MAEDEGSENIGGIFMIWSRKQLVGPRMVPDVINQRMLELETAKELKPFIEFEYYERYESHF
jgi:hypothetical protein